MTLLIVILLLVAFIFAKRARDKWWQQKGKASLLKTPHSGERDAALCFQSVPAALPRNKICFLLPLRHCNEEVILDRTELKDWVDFLLTFMCCGLDPKV